MQAFNPYLPSYEYVPDGEPRLFNGRVYLYGSHDRFGGPEFCMNDYVCWSAPEDDLADWRYEGVIYRRTQDPRNAENKMALFAPDCVQGPDGRYYLYYSFNKFSVTAVAVSSSPAGPFAYLGEVHTPDGKPYCGEGSVNNFDPGVLVDDDGSVYLYSGFSPKPGPLRDMLSKRGTLLDGGYCIPLEKDMLTIKSQPRLVIPGYVKAADTGFEGHAFFEASSPRKINGRYYLLYSSELSHELCYATAPSPMGPFTYGGTVISNGDIGYHGRMEPDNYTGNTHGGLVQIKGRWYIFHHRQTNRQTCSRQGTAEPVEILADGSILQAECTSCGLNGGPLQDIGSYEARIACCLYSASGAYGYDRPAPADADLHPYFTQSGSDREENPDQYIANLHRGSTAGFKYFAFSGAPRKLSVTVRAKSHGTMELCYSPDGSPVAVIAVTPCAEWQSFFTGFTPTSGTKALYFTWQGDAPCDFTVFSLE